MESPHLHSNQFLYRVDHFLNLIHQISWQRRQYTVAGDDKSLIQSDSLLDDGNDMRNSVVNQHFREVLLTDDVFLNQDLMIRVFGLQVFNVFPEVAMTGGE